MNAAARRRSLFNFVRIVSRGQTDVGRKRDHNEDSLLINESMGLFVVADGMGGHAGGELASRLAVAAVEDKLVDEREANGALFDPGLALADAEELSNLLREAFDHACSTIFSFAEERPRLAGMGTTLTALLVQGKNVFIAHVGDSRAYLIRDATIKQLTEDHSLVNEQIKAGMLTPEQAERSPLKNIITRSVGFERHVAADVFGVEAEEGDVFLLCSDGLSNLVDDDTILRLVRSEPFERLPQALIDQANERGGDDNITAIVIGLGGGFLTEGEEQT